jgi:hypothetical protein
MNGTSAFMAEIQRERRTEQRVRANDVVDTVAEIHALEDEREALSERLAEAERDAARYRWLRNTNGQHWDDLLRDGGNIMDARIDAAMLSRE